MSQGGKKKYLNNAILTRSLSSALLVLSTSLPFEQVLALGVGGIKTQSYIGQPLRVEIPLYNVEAPNSLKVEFERLDDSNAEGLSAVLSRENSQLSVLIVSEGAVNEPYFNFALNLNDQGNEFRKQFTVLLDLSPSDERESASQSAAQPYNDRSAELAAENVAGSNDLIAGAVMGPYDWAESGSIPEKFGAVLDGQSLWRVARRISPAMNVTNNQMMWALYQANPEAFSTDKIESLKAGTYLSIPRPEQVAAVSDSEAQRLLSNLSSGSAAPTRANVDEQAVSVNADLTQDSEDVENSIDDEPADDLQQTELESDSELVQGDGQNFQLTGLGTKVNEDGELVSAGGQSEEIIASLSDTIASMTEQLGRKDEQIEALEGQVAELKEFIEADGTSIESIQSTGSTVSAPAVTTAPTVTTAPAVTTNVAEEKATQFNSRYAWLLGVLGLLVLGLILFRKRLLGLWQSLNLGGDKEQIEFAPNSYEESEVNQPSIAVVEPRARTDANYTSTNSESETVAGQTEAPDSILELTSELDFDEPYSEPEVFEVEEDLDFDERFAKLLEEGEFDFARQLLDIAHGREVEHEKYHFYRLQLLAKTNDEDAFYDYYYSIENDISNFDSTIQTDISKLVVQLAQH